jgi:hypothetical protein
MCQHNVSWACLFVGAAVFGAASATQAGALGTYVNGLGPGAGEANYVVLQFPASFSAQAFTSTPTVYGQIYQTGMTEPAGPNPNIVAQFGFGPFGSNPLADDTGWVWFGASYNLQAGNNDEYQRFITAPAAGTYAYTYRFNLSTAGAAGGYGWTLADLDGAGVNSTGYSPAQLGVMSVTPAPGTGVLLSVGGLWCLRRRRR